MSIISRVTSSLGAHFRNKSVVANRSSLSSILKRSCSTNQDLVLVESRNEIQLIGINRPEKRNCVNQATGQALLQAFKEFDKDDSAKVAVLYGVGGYFSAGLDLKEVSLETSIKQLTDSRGPMVASYTACVGSTEKTGGMTKKGPTHYETTKPVIAAIEGYAVAGGMELALWCDIRIVDHQAIMGVFCRRYGVPLIDGGTFRLPAVVGMGTALDLILTGRPISADRALEIGLANQISEGNALEDAIKYAEGLVGFPQEALRADRNSARRAFSASSIEESLLEEYKKGIVALEEAREGAATFVDGKGRHGKFD